MTKIFSFDAETNGLWGQPFAVAAINYEGCDETDRFIGRCPIEEEVNEWVAQNVLPQMGSIDISHGTYDALLKDFSNYYIEKVKNLGSLVIAHMATPVESGLIKDMHDRGYIGDFDGPYPLIDLSASLLQINEDPTSVDSYAKKYGITVSPEDYAGGTHNPLFDCAQTAVVYNHLLSRK